MTKDQLMKEIEYCDGFEVPRPLWPLAEELAGEGKITLGGARGPGGDFRRAELMQE